MAEKYCAKCHRDTIYYGCACELLSWADEQAAAIQAGPTDVHWRCRALADRAWFAGERFGEMKASKIKRWKEWTYDELMGWWYYRLVMLPWKVFYRLRWVYYRIRRIRRRELPSK